MQTRLGFEAHPGYLKVIFTGAHPLQPVELLTAVRAEAQRTGNTRILADCLAPAPPHLPQAPRLNAEIGRHPRADGRHSCTQSLQTNHQR